ncbi:MAG TPA: hypothetical protein VMA53_05165 [Stellaceae bacterium]|nr:hypothetical protein [Stellaceae bacterium]
MAKFEYVAGFWIWLRVQFFRLWTALLVLGAYGYLWVNEPEYLTWWKRAIDAVIEKGCSLLPYPWGDRIETTLGNFGLWVQITLTILFLRALAGIFIVAFRRNHFYGPVVRPPFAQRDAVLRGDTSFPSPPSSRPPPEAR